jgi:hypothetical protein
MDISKFIEGLGLAKGAVELLKGAKDLLPDSPKKDAAAQSLRLAEETFRIAETQAAQELGYHLCACTWPPQIALRQPDGSRRCPGCGRDTNEDYRSRGGGSY